MTNEYYQKHKDKVGIEACERNKIFWKNLKANAKKLEKNIQFLLNKEKKQYQCYRERNTSLSAEQTQNLFDYTRDYYAAYNK